ncbi:Hsp20/alpha crystallin family protein [Amycolatopsis australiensis]|uniref:HSP20 family protein n=1 Tax=Amycolatopsis australiensis TaxID=546364 RepID=A0A1K1SGX2_9PSEU|nr:Hsp20/alpha crystallin family protein [Amycolatopsis australiensis]SFW83640.1 HSP20 family protein [Amycolatopsis australiensis]
MLMRTDPFRELDRLTQQFFGAPGTASRPAAVPMDAYRDGSEFVVRFDLPGVTADSITLDVERNVLTVRAERAATAPDGAEYLVGERPRGVFSRRLFLGDALDTDRIEAGYDAGVLTVRIPVAERAKARRITVGSGDAKAQLTA